MEEVVKTRQMPVGIAVHAFNVNERLAASATRLAKLRAGARLVAGGQRKGFGASAARRSEEHLRSMGTEQLVQVGDAVVECDTADELLAVAGDATQRDTQSPTTRATPAASSRLPPA